MTTKDSRPALNGPPRPRLSGERGSALIITLMATALLTALGVALVLTSSTETMISANYRSSQETMYAADAALERGMQDLLAESDWTRVLTAIAKSTFVDTAADHITPSGAPVDLEARTTTLQNETDAWYGADPNRPLWRLYAHSPLDRLLPGSVVTRGYVAVWVADDPAETDGDPTADSNNIVLVRATAFGEFGSLKTVESAARRLGTPGDPERGYRGQSGQGERSDRYRSGGIASPTESTMNLQTGGSTVKP